MEIDDLDNLYGQGQKHKRDLGLHYFINGPKQAATAELAKYGFIFISVLLLMSDTSRLSMIEIWNEIGIKSHKIIKSAKIIEF